MDILKQSTAVTIVMGPMLDDTDGNTPEATLTIAQADIRLSKNGGAYAQTNNAAGATHMEVGKYSVPLNTTDTATLGKLRVDIHESGALAVWREFTVVTADVYDSLVLGTDVLHADVTHWLGTEAATPTIAGVPEVDITHLGGVAQSATDLKDFTDTGYDPATHKVQGVVLVDTTTANTDNRELLLNKVGFNEHTGNNKINLASGSIVDGAYVGCTVVVYDVSNNDYPCVRRCIAFTGFLREVTLDSDVNFTIGISDKASIYATRSPTAEEIVNEWETQSQADPTGFHVNVKEVNGTAQTANDNSADINEILTDTGEIGAAGAGLTDIGGMSTGMKSEVNTEVADVMTIDTVSEPPQGPPPSTPTFEQMFAYMYFRLMNKNEETATEHAVYDVAGTTKVIKATVSDTAGTLTKSAFESGA